MVQFFFLSLRKNVEQIRAYPIIMAIFASGFRHTHTQKRVEEEDEEEERCWRAHLCDAFCRVLDNSPSIIKSHVSRLGCIHEMQMPLFLPDFIAAGGTCNPFVDGRKNLMDELFH